jgi:hypothetical protein
MEPAQKGPEPLPPEPTPPEINHDFLFKQLISTFFLDFLQLFAPQLAALIEPDSVRFLQQEHFTDIVEGEKRILDLLAEVKLARDPAAILIDVEAESTRRSAFAQRLFFYFALLYQRHLKRVYPLALFTYDQPKNPAQSSHSMEVADLKVLDFQFKAIQLNRLDWRAYLNQSNPVAAALMAKMDIAPEDRPKVKAECLRLLVTLQLDPAKSLLISSFIDTYLRMSQTEKPICN